MKTAPANLGDLSNQALKRRIEMEANKQNGQAAGLYADELIRRDPSYGSALGNLLLAWNPKASVRCFKAALRSGSDPRETYVQMSQAYGALNGALLGLCYRPKYGRKAVDCLKRAKQGENDHSLDGALFSAYVDQFLAPSSFRLFPLRSQKSLRRAFELVPTAIPESPSMHIKTLGRLLHYRLNRENRQAVRDIVVPALAPYLRSHARGEEDYYAQSAALDIRHCLAKKPWASATVTATLPTI